MSAFSPRLRRVALALTSALFASVTGIVGFASPASAAPRTYVVAGDVDTATGDFWGFHESYFTELRAVLADPANFGASGRVRANFSVGTPRTVPLAPNSLNGLDVYFLSARDLFPPDITELQRFRQSGGAIVANSNAANFFDTTAWLGLTLSPKVVYGDGPAPYDTTHKAPAPSTRVAGQENHPVLNGPFGVVNTFENWHTVAGFANTPANATMLTRTTLTGPNDNGSPTNVSITNVGTVAVYPNGTFSPGSGPVIATSDVDTFSNAYTVLPNALIAGDGACTLTGTGNGVLARNAFAWIADQLMALHGLTTFVPLTSPVRALDTRSGLGGPASPFDTGAQRQLSFTGTGVPVDATMVAVNITAVDPTATGYLTAWPAGSTVPEVSNVNFVAGTTVANAAFVRLGANSQISLFNSAGSTHVLVDVVGYVGATGSRLVNLVPTRIKDTRTGLGGTGIAHTATTQTLRVTGTAGVPDGATAVVLNVTAVDPTATAYVTVWPTDRTQPTVSNINTSAGTTVPNLVVVRLPTSGGSIGSINLFNAAGDTHLLVDVLGYFTTTAPTGAVSGAVPSRVLDTRGPRTPLGFGETRTISTGLAGATAVIINVTAVDPSGAGYLTVFAADSARPDASNVNFLAGRTSPNLVVVHPAADGTIKVYNSAGTTHLLVDVIGRFDG